MANYDKQTWTARVATGDNKFTDQNGNNYTFTPNPDSVTTAGTPFSASRMNYMEDGIAQANNMYDRAKWWTYTGVTGTGSIVDAIHCGGWITVRVRVNSTASTSAGGTFASGTLIGKNGDIQFFPEIITESIGQYGGVPLLAVLDGTTLTVTNIGTTSIASGHSARFTFVFPYSLQTIE